jgi:predicted PurR-regulated permease PerM
LATAAFLYAVRAILPPFIIAAFLSYVLEPLVTLVQRRGVSRARSILLVYAGLVLALALFVLYFVPAFARDVQGLAEQVPKLIGLVQSYAASARETVIRYNLPAGLERGLVDTLRRMEDVLSSLGVNAFSYFLSSATILSYVVVAPVITYYILKDINKWRKRALVAMARYPLPYVDLLRDVDQVLTGFMRGQSIVAASVTAMMWIALAILGIRFGAALGLIAGLAEFIPFFGPFIAGVPVALLAFMKSPATGLWSVVAVAIVQWIDSNVIVPRVTGPRVGLHPLWIIFALFAGGELLGFWGLFLAVPTAGVTGAILKFGKTMLARP